MSKETVLDMTLPKETNKPDAGELTGLLDTTNPSKETSRLISSPEMMDNTYKDLNGFGDNLKDQLLPIDMDMNDLSFADAEKLNILSHNDQEGPEGLEGEGEDAEKLNILSHNDQEGPEGLEGEGEDGIGFRMGNGSVHGTLDKDADVIDSPNDPTLVTRRTTTEETPNVNAYQQKKNLAQGMMDLALLSANANQLRYVLETSAVGHPYYYSSITLISLSIILQVAVGVGLILNSRYDYNHPVEISKADQINNMTVLGVFLITIVNVFISSFSVAPSNTAIPIHSTND